MERALVTLTPRPPFDFKLTAASAVYFRDHSGTDRFDGSCFQRLLYLNGQLCLASVRSSGTMDSPRLEVEITGNAIDDMAVREARRQVAWILDINSDLLPFYQMAIQDRTLAPLVEALKGLHVVHNASVFEGLVLAVLGQQISSHIARILRNLFIQTYGPSLKISGVTYHAFPKPETLAITTVDELRALGFSTRKAEYILGIATEVASGRLDLEGLCNKPDEEVIHVLTSIRGVGLWTAHWLLIRALGRNDGFPHSDLALCRTLGALLKEAEPLKPEQALDYSRRWSPFRSLVTAYVFAALRSGCLSPPI